MGITTEDWSHTPLDELLIHVIGGDWGKDESFNEDDYEMVSCIRGSEFKNWKKELGSTAVNRRIKTSSLNTRKLKDGDLLIEISGGGPDQPVGRTVLITSQVLEQLKHPAVCTNFLRMARPSREVNSNYLNYYLTKFYLSGEVVRYQGGSNNLRNLKFKDYSGIAIPLPPLAEQKVIAEKLDTLLAQVDTTKARLERIPDIIKRFRQSVLAAAVSGKLTEEWRGRNTAASDDIPETWKLYQAKEVCEKVQSGSTPKGNPFDQDGDIPFLKVYNIVDQKISFDYKPQFITSEVHKSSSRRSIVTPTDVLMNIVGPPLGKVAIVTEQFDEWNINQAITLFRADPEKLNFKFLYFVLCEGDLVRKVMPDTKGSVGQVNISLTQCREALIPLPSLREQTEIVRRVEELFVFADTIEKKAAAALERVNNLTQSILAKAFRGELTADWRAANPELITGDNSAEALLAKIQTEREALKSTNTSRSKKKARVAG